VMSFMVGIIGAPGSRRNALNVTVVRAANEQCSLTAIIVALFKTIFGCVMLPKFFMESCYGRSPGWGNPFALSLE
jgi:hypothetical protein